MERERETPKARNTTAPPHAAPSESRPVPPSESRPTALSELTAAEKAVGAKQVRQAVRNRRAVRVYLACDADPAVTEPLETLCREYGVPAETGLTMRQIGKACGIAVGASAAASVGEL